MIYEYGGGNYTIFLDKETLALFGYVEIEDKEKWIEVLRPKYAVNAGLYSRYYGNKFGNSP